MSTNPSIEPPIPPVPRKGLGEKIKLMAGKIAGLFSGFRKLQLVQKSEAAVDFLLKKTSIVTSKISPVIPPGIRDLLFKSRGKIFLGLIALFLFFGLKNCMFPGKKTNISLEQMVGQQKQAENGPIPVKGFKVARFNFEDSLNALGTIKGAVEFKLSFEIPGTISSINYREGERYEEGALLLSLKQDDILLRLKRAQAEMNKAQTQSQIAEEKVKEHEKLFAMGAIPKTTLENVKLELDSSKFETEAARLEVKANEAMLEKSNLYAPSAGMIGELSVEEGEAITPNTLLGTHIMTEYVYAEFGIVERDVNKIALGQKARVFVDAFPDKTFEGVIENISPVVTGTSRTATVRVRIENPDRLLLPGMFTRIRILLYSKKNTLVVPTDAVQGNEGEKFIYVINGVKPKQSEAPADGAAQAPNAMLQNLQGQAAQMMGSDQALPEGLGEQAPAEEKQKAAEKPKKKKKSKNLEMAPEKKEEAVQTVEKRAITIGYTRPDYSQIDAGITEGEIVAISSLDKLEDGKKVRLLETQEAEV